MLVYPPNTQTKYSNVGPTVTGHVVELVAGMPFAEYQRKHVCLGHWVWRIRRF